MDRAYAMAVIKPPAAIPPVGVVGSGGSGTDKRRDDTSGDKEEPSSQYRPSPHHVNDMVTALADDITPGIQKIIDALMARVDGLSLDLERAKGRERFLEQRSDSHSFLDILNRRAFLGYLGRILANIGQLGDSASLIMVNLLNGERIRNRYGRRALDRALEHMVNSFSVALHKTDPVGGLGGNDFGIVLLIADTEAARIKVKELINAVRNKPLMWHDNEIFLEVAFGVCPLVEGLSQEEAIEVADRDMLSGDDIG